MNYLDAEIGYNITSSRLGFSYKLVDEIDSGCIQHWLTVSKAYNSVIIAVTAVFNVIPDEKYQILTGAQDTVVYALLSMEL